MAEKFRYGLLIGRVRVCNRRALESLAVWRGLGDGRPPLPCYSDAGHLEPAAAD